MPNKKKKYNSRFPPARIKRIIQQDDDVGKVAAAVPVIIFVFSLREPRALELFIESLLQNASQITRARNAKTLTTTHLKQCILAENKFDFLKDLVACVPDVQADDEASNPPTLLSQPAAAATAAAAAKSTATSYKYKRMQKTRLPDRGNASGGGGGGEDDEDDDDEEDDDDSDEEDEDDYRSEDSLDHRSTSTAPSTKQQLLRPLPMTSSHINGVQPTETPAAVHVFGSTFAAAAAKSVSELDEDYDS